MRLLICLLTLLLNNPKGPPTSMPAVATPDDAWKILTDGHERWRHGAFQNPHRDADRRRETVAGGQHPYAIVLSCADSRAPVEVIFDAGIGDIFVVRVAGNVANNDEIATIEYGVEHLGVPLVVVLGHSKCGAVTAVVEHAHVSDAISKLVAPIAPAVERAKKHDAKVAGAALISAAIHENVRQSIQSMLNESEIIKEAAAAGKIRIVGGVYDLESGEIEWLDPATTQEAVTTASSAHQASPSVAPKKKQENFLALAGLLAGASIASFLLIRLMDSRKTA